MGKYIFLLILSFFTFGAFGDVEISPKLGFGYDSNTGMPRNMNCFKNNALPDNIRLQNFEQSIDFDHSMSMAELSSFTSISLSGSFGFGWFSASASAKYARDASDTRYSSNFNFLQTFAADANYNLPDAFGIDLSEAGHQALNAGPEMFAKFCGNQYVASARLGAVLLVNVGISFETALDKTIFQSDFSGGISGIASISAAYEQLSHQQK